MSFANTEQEEFWADMAPTWIAMDEQLERVGGPPGRLAMDRLGLAPGQHVLDIGCGTGPSTVDLAARVGADGRVVGIDISDAMLEGARARAARLGVANVEFVHADAQVQDLGAGRYDAAFSRFGIMFFADPVAALGNIRRALRGGGALSFACWQGVFENEWMFVPGAAAMAVTGQMPPMPGPDEPGPFSMADPGRVRTLLDAAGFADVDVVAHNDQVVVPEDLVGAIVDSATRVGAVRESLRDADDDTRRRVTEAVDDALRSRIEHGELRLSRGVLLVTARPPS